MNVNLHIERLVLHGVDVERPELLGATMAAELTRLLAADTSEQLVHLESPRAHARTTPIAISANERTTGRAVGRAVHAVLLAQPAGAALS